ncbi:predicted protein [Naegleria gruberi]|uniref:Predicted protein n=1 Tax=Naegleria gruberi TaxID=5762 RepID=D2VSU9_NAEGR|nr:uncharacterized protein NAEGRDRAFT_72069 [Naegleria gruberi]EFC40043.1 predicted protein [Naegleria gruberi]|eukprot:XP_002672787.1 predicted protein [Naegleria gruberi strain NEG-M]
MRIHGRNGQSPLMVAAQQENLDSEIIKCLISAGCNMGMKDFDGKTSFIHACENGNYEIAKIIYEKSGKGRNAIRFVLKGEDPLTLAVKSGNEQLVNWLASTEIIRSSRKKALLVSIEKGDYWIFKSVFDHCCLDADFNWYNILKMSCDNIKIDMLKLILPKCKEIGPLELESYASQATMPNVRNEFLLNAKKKRQELIWKDLKPAFLIREKAKSTKATPNSQLLLNHPLNLVCDDSFHLICSFLITKPVETSIRYFIEKKDGVKIWHFYDGGPSHRSWSDYDGGEDSSDDDDYDYYDDY